MTDITMDNFIEVGRANGISYKTVWTRVHYQGWTPQEAATVPVKANHAALSAKP